MKTPPFLKAGDKIILLATSGKIDPDISLKAAENLRAKGFVVDVFPTAISSHHYFSGDVSQRLGEFQNAIDDPNCKAILCARGGYGAIHLLDKLNWNGFLKYPKWIIGFSDITLIHAAVQKLSFVSLHGAMAEEFASMSPDAKKVLSFISGEYKEISWEPEFKIEGKVEGEIIGGNLSLLTAILGSKWEPEWNNKVLFLEDIGEYLYKLDRMLWTLKLHGVFDKISGLVIGQMTDISDTKVPYGKTFHEILFEIIEEYDIPVATNIDAGHDTPNHAVVLGAQVCLHVFDQQTKLTYQ